MFSIDSTGLGTIAHSAQQIQANTGQIYVICTKPQIKKIFEVSGLLTKNLTLFESEDQISGVVTGVRPPVKASSSEKEPKSVKRKGKVINIKDFKRK